MSEKAYQKTDVEKAVVLERLRSKGFRITRQREQLLDVILESTCTSCKEIYFCAQKKKQKVGLATIYRMINLLEEIGVLQTRNEYQICAPEDTGISSCMIEFENEQKVVLDREKLYQVLEKGMKQCGFANVGPVKCVIVSEGENEKISQQGKRR